MRKGRRVIATAYLYLDTKSILLYAADSCRYRLIYSTPLHKDIITTFHTAPPLQPTRCINLMSRFIFGNRRQQLELAPVELFAHYVSSSNVIPHCRSRSTFGTGETSSMLINIASSCFLDQSSLVNSDPFIRTTDRSKIQTGTAIQ